MAASMRAQLLSESDGSDIEVLSQSEGSDIEDERIEDTKNELPNKASIARDNGQEDEFDSSHDEDRESNSNGANENEVRAGEKVVIGLFLSRGMEFELCSEESDSVNLHSSLQRVWNRRPKCSKISYEPISFDQERIAFASLIRHNPQTIPITIKNAPQNENLTSTKSTPIPKYNYRNPMNIIRHSSSPHLQPLLRLENREEQSAVSHLEHLPRQERPKNIQRVTVMQRHNKPKVEAVSEIGQKTANSSNLGQKTENTAKIITTDKLPILIIEMADRISSEILKSVYEHSFLQQNVPNEPQEIVTSPTNNPITSARNVENEELRCDENLDDKIEQKIESISINIVSKAINKSLNLN